MLQVRDLTVEAGGRPVVEGASFSVRAGERVGLVGRNGAGKTSLLQALAGEAPALAGSILRSDGVGYLRQEPLTRGRHADLTAVAHVLSGRGMHDAAERLEALRRSLEEGATAKRVERYSGAEEAFRAAGGYAAESEARRIAAGLGLAADRLDLPLPALSGGERRRIELARILFAGSALLLLDEPTNHLDTDAKAWLMSFLASYRGALIVVSHDLHLLDRSITRVLHLDEAALVEYRGTYSQYLEARRLDEARLERTALHQQREIRRLSTLADSMRHQTEKRARTAKTLDRRVERLAREAVSAPRRQRRVTVRFPDPPRSGNLVVDAAGLSMAYGGPPVFEDVSFILGRGERLLVMGLNGAGKTTLLRILAGETEPDGGTVRLGAGVSLGYYAQEHEGIRPGVRVLDHLREASPAPEQQLRAVMGTFHLTGDVAFQDAGTLSGGEKTKLALAQLVAGRHNLILLDEPTNNLDPPSRTAVGRALASWGGSMIVVTHDREFVEALTQDRALIMPEATLDPWSDDLLELVALA